MAKPKDVGMIIHYYSDLSVAVIAVASTFSKGDTLLIGKGEPFLKQKAISLQLEHQKIEKNPQRAGNRAKGPGKSKDWRPSAEDYIMISATEISAVFSKLEPHHPQTMLEQLKQYSVFQQLVATLLSSRTKDTTTIPIVKKLFEKYKTPDDFLNTHQKVLAQELYGIGFYRIKAKNIQKLSQIINNKYHGEVPRTREELILLPGVGRKTANCMLNYAFHQPAIAVDVHVHRISNRLGWVKTTTPEETENALAKVVPKNLWIKINMLLVGHGQTICLPQRPKCSVCPVRQYCAYGKQKQPH